MKTTKLFVAALVIAISMGSRLHAGDAAPVSAPPNGSAVPSEVQTPVGEVLRPEKSVPPVDRGKLSPMHREIYDAVESERAQIVALEERYRSSVLISDKIAIQKEVESIKKNGQIVVLEIQLRYAKAAANGEAVRQLEMSIGAIQAPKVLPGEGATVLERMGGGSE